MGLGPVSAAIGVASTISGMAEQKRQAAAQQAQIAASQKAADASAALRKTEIDTQRNYTEYTARLNALNRQQQEMQSRLGNQASNILADIQTSQANFQAEQTLLGAKQAGEQQRGEANKQRANTEQQASAAKSASYNQSQGNQQAIAQSAAEGGKALDEGERRRSVMQAILAATGGGAGRTQEALIAKDLGQDVAAALTQRLQLEGVSEADLRQLAYNKDIAEIARQLGVGSADFMSGNADRAEQYASKLSAGIIADNNTSAALARQNSDVAMQQMKAAMASDANADKVNSILSEYGFNAQQNASNMQLAQQRSSLAAQSMAASGGNGGLFSLLGAGMNAYNQISASSPMRGQQQSAQPSYGFSANILKPYDYSKDYGSNQGVSSGYTGNTLMLNL